MPAFNFHPTTLSKLFFGCRFLGYSSTSTALKPWSVLQESAWSTIIKYMKTTHLLLEAFGAGVLFEVKQATLNIISLSQQSASRREFTWKIAELLVFLNFATSSISSQMAHVSLSAGPQLLYKEWLRRPTPTHSWNGVSASFTVMSHKVIWACGK